MLTKHIAPPLNYANSVILTVVELINIVIFISETIYSYIKFLSQWAYCYSMNYRLQPFTSRQLFMLSYVFTVRK